MSTFLFNDIIFGPVNSRRLGISLGINLLPLNSKLCNFDCLYCECGLSKKIPNSDSRLPSSNEVRNELKKTLEHYKNKGKNIDTITFAGNGEPTLHPHFPTIINDTIQLREELFPEVKIAVLSNATLIDREEIKNALLKVDFNILKLDSANEEHIRRVNCPSGNFSVKKLIQNLSYFKNNLTIQTLFLKGEFNGFYFDNSSNEEVDAWLSILEQLKPKLVMVYTIARDTPVDNLEKVSDIRLNEIASKVEQIGIPVTVSA